MTERDTAKVWIPKIMEWDLTRLSGIFYFKYHPTKQTRARCRLYIVSGSRANIYQFRDCIKMVLAVL
jgi:hypothetical protein